MNKNTIVADLIGYFVTESKNQEISITADQDLFETGVLDSLQIIILFSFVESKFNTTLSFDNLTEENLKSANAIADLIIRSAAS